MLISIIERLSSLPHHSVRGESVAPSEHPSAHVVDEVAVLVKHLDAVVVADREPAVGKGGHVARPAERAVGLDGVLQAA